MARNPQMFWKRLAWITAALVVLGFIAVFAGSLVLTGKKTESTMQARIAATSVPAPAASATRTIANTSGPSGAAPPVWRRVDTVATDAKLLQPYATGWDAESKPAF